MELIGAKVKHAKFGNGIVTKVDGESVFVSFKDEERRFLLEIFHEKFSFEDDKVCDSVKVFNQAGKLEKEKEKFEKETKRIKMQEGVNVVDSEHTVKVWLEHADVSFRESLIYCVDNATKRLIIEIFKKCDEETEMLYYEYFNPKMEYPKITSKATSSYSIGMMSAANGHYVFRVFLRDDIYKKGKRKGVTIFHSNTTEVVRVVFLNGRVYRFFKNIKKCRGATKTTCLNGFWTNGYVNDIILDEVIRACDCGYLNNYIAEKNMRCLDYAKVALAALVDNKAEIIFKNRLYESASHIDNLIEYLSEYTKKQVDFASKNNLLHALPIIKECGIYKADALVRVEEFMKRICWRGSLFEIVKEIFRVRKFDTSNLYSKIVAFVNKVEEFDLNIYYDYLRLLCDRYQVESGDVFAEDYIDRYYAMSFGSKSYSYMESQRYNMVVQELTWIDREEDGYYITVPKTIEEFRKEGEIQSICVYNMRYYNYVSEKKSIIVFLRKEKDTPYVTIEYDYASFKVLQARLKFNKVPDKELVKYIEDLGKRLYRERESM